jgi:multicomponent Na+:H+ antiporter subunit E
MKHAVVLGLVMYGLWLLLSGIFQPLLLALGALSCVFVVWLSARMRVLDTEGELFDLHIGRLLAYAPWLIKEILLSNLDVARRIAGGRDTISPRVIRVPCTQRTDLARTIYANSITLTPGTVSIDMGEGDIVVHALSREGAEGLATGEMGERVAALERGR